MKNWHSTEVDQVLKELNTDSRQGLRHEEVRNRLEKYGYNGPKKGERRRPPLLTKSNILALGLLFAAVLALTVLTTLLCEISEKSVTTPEIIEVLEKVFAF